MINVTNDLYRKKNLALIQKIPTPIIPTQFDNKQRVITQAYFEQKSTVDFLGAIQGFPICFDAKEIKATSLPLANIHKHQIEFMQDFIKQGGVAFFIVYFRKYEKFFLAPFEFIQKYFMEAMSGGRKSIPYKDFQLDYEISLENGQYLHYIKVLQKYIDKMYITQNNS
ncbi:Holliday junction resolvase RecU [Candidatus Epulonipiscioides saccharophilum]|nr:Holliday junction resolvase RecU [Epulopiscium sp. SCG-B10WGA-EpuloB]